eukprot:scaffold26888_cov137-Cylindrotheca_fusiformis.AAC.5
MASSHKTYDNTLPSQHYTVDSTPQTTMGDESDNCKNLSIDRNCGTGPASDGPAPLSGQTPSSFSKKKVPSWYRKEGKREPRDTQQSLEDYFGLDAFRVGKGESIETVVEGTDVAILWETERNKTIGIARPALQTSYRRRVVHDVLSAEYSSEDSDEDSSVES